jgi:undecaprenyl-diphosphatase
MNNLHALALGAIQGLTEVLPISSSAHLIIIPQLSGWPESGLTFDVALHLGTLVALSLYFWRDILDMSYNFIGSISGKGLHSAGNRLPWYIIIATIPAAIVGKTFEEPIEQVFRHNTSIICSFHAPALPSLPLYSSASIAKPLPVFPFCFLCPSFLAPLFSKWVISLNPAFLPAR